MPNLLNIQVIHRNKLLKSKDSFYNEIKDKKNVLIIMDEIQLAAKKEPEQTIYKLFKVF